MTPTAQSTDTPGIDFGVLIPVRVHFDELDPMRMLHNSRYAVLVDRAWNDYWRGQGLGGDRGLEGDGFHVIKSFEITFDFPLTELGEHAVHLWMERVGGSSATAGYRVCSADGGTTYAHGTRTVVRLDPATLTPTKWSERVHEIARIIGRPRDQG
ncbi:acyl-CoA thioesterase [Streptomyces sp. NPDC090106]|uniref:acyl-CoA thioesterase n=1 Tax=Streptomyces sp. NPDC090106 TaxID=3365946 RepID=UPI003803C8B0